MDAERAALSQRERGLRARQAPGNLTPRATAADVHNQQFGLDFACERQREFGGGIWGHWDSHAILPRPKVGGCRRRQRGLHLRDGSSAATAGRHEDMR